MLPPGERRKTKAINVLLPGAKTKGILLLGNIVRGIRHKKNTTIRTKTTAKYCYRGNITGENHRVLPPKKNFNRKLVGFVRGEYHYTKSIIFPKKKEVILPLNTSYEAYDINKILPSGEYYRRKL